VPTRPAAVLVVVALLGTVGVLAVRADQPGPAAPPAPAGTAGGALARPAAAGPPGQPRPTATATRAPAPPAAPATPPPVHREIASYLAGRQGRVSVAYFDARTGVYHALENGPHLTASLVKVSLLEAVLDRAARQRRELTAAERRLVEPMIRVSDNAAAETLWVSLGGPATLLDLDRRLGTRATTPDANPGRWGQTRTTALDQVTLVQRLAYPTPLLRPADQRYGLGLMRTVDPAQRWGVSAGVPEPSWVAVKNGWLPLRTGWQVNSVGHVRGGGRDYVVAVLTNSPGLQYGITTISGVSRILWKSLG
jgi:beta-lactamase class A